MGVMIEGVRHADEPASGSDDDALRCGLFRRLQDYPNLWGYTRELYQMPGIARTCDLEAYKQGYYSFSELRNPPGIVPKGPVIDFATPHGRGRLNGEVGQRAAAS